MRLSRFTVTVKTRSGLSKLLHTRRQQLPPIRQKIATPQSQGHGRSTLHHTAAMSNVAAGRDHPLPGGLKCSSGSQKSSPRSLFFPSPKTEGQAPAASAADRLRNVLLFFIPGNPGLVEYYDPFLSHLRRLLDESGPAAVAVDLYGTSLSGFDDADHDAPFRIPGNPPRDVADQIGFVEARLAEVCAAAARPYDAVMVMGHSVGAYIACEVVHRGKQRRRQAQEQPVQNGNGLTRTSPDVFRAGILLFPTIAHIALSPYAHVAAALLLSVLPLALLRFLLRASWKMPPHAVETTAAWLGSRDGVWQALHMGKDEMRVIGEDHWGDGFWEEVGGDNAAPAAAGPGDAGTRFFLLYGKNDHWVAEDVRDAFLAKREAKKGLRTKVVVDDTGVLPHDFCINYSEPVAEKVKVWLEEALEGL
ncbi:hypothetical protein PspLS_05960 [Pyricularia sp. CBS 133598]|nr:hypothetical protein PspLS_05960 [Pyricularia sp. CBS 133598]